MIPRGLLSLGRRNLGALALVYVLCTGVALAVPAYLASSSDVSHRRGDPPHPTPEPTWR